MPGVDRAIARWWLSSCLVLMLCAASWAVAMEAWDGWRAAPLTADRGGHGVVAEDERRFVTAACTTSEEEELGTGTDFDYARVATLAGESLFACYRTTRLGVRGRLVDAKGTDVGSAAHRGRLGVAPWLADARSRLDLAIWGLLVPPLVVGLLYLHQTVLRRSRNTRRFGVAAQCCALIAYLLVCLGSEASHDGPGLLLGAVAGASLSGLTLLARVDLGRVLRRLDVTPGPPQGAQRPSRQAATPPHEEAAEPVRTPADKVRAREERIDPNTATEDELAALPGVGPVSARRIIERRSEGRGVDFDELCDIVRPTRRVRDRLRLAVRFDEPVRRRDVIAPESADHDDPYGGRRVDT